MTLATAQRIGIGDVRVSLKATQNVLDALTHNRLSYGRYTRQFESELARIQHHTFACFMNSGTSALQVGLAALKERYGWRDGDKILVPALTFVASLNVILQNGLKPVLIDVDPDFYDMDVFSIPDGRGAAVGMLPVSLFGQPYNDQLSEVASLRGWKILHDSCETMFVGRPAADIACYSTYACHLISTGVGGFAATDDPDLAVLIRSLMNHGRNGVYAGIDDALGQWETIQARFQFDRPGYSYRATEMEAAIGCAELETYAENIVARRTNARTLTALLADLPLQLPRERVAGEHAFMLYPVVCLEDERDALIQHLEANGIETRPMLPLTNQPYMKYLFGADVEDRFPVAKRLNERGFVIPCHQYLTVEDIAQITGAFHVFYD